MLLSGGIPITVPRAEHYSVHKIIRSKRRKTSCGGQNPRHGVRPSSVRPGSEESDRVGARSATPVFNGCLTMSAARCRACRGRQDTPRCTKAAREVARLFEDDAHEIDGERQRTLAHVDLLKCAGRSAPAFALSRCRDGGNLGRQGAGLNMATLGAGSL
jgi:hypothetical protein